MSDPIEFTGERFVPGVAGEIEIEHVHRYAFAARHVAGRRVLDVACGEGYGGALLAAGAAQVAGVDIDADTLAHAAVRYATSRNLAFHRASATALPFADASFDAVVSFETIEHLDAPDQPKMLAEIARVLAPRGIVVLSAPNRVEYSERRAYVNPFHRHEHDRAELAALLAAHFGAVRWFHQRVWLGSTLWCEEGGDAFAAQTGATSGVEPARAPPAMYFVVIAARDAADLPHDTLALSLFADRGQREWERVNELLAARDAQLAEVNEHVRHLEELVGYRDGIIVERDRILQEQALRMMQFERQEEAFRATIERDAAELAAGRQQAAQDRTEIAEAHAALAAQERIIDYRQSARWWVRLPWLKLQGRWRRLRGG
jgi:ubiquinone/menaquinone biosynthesis C-methylase UbiE